MRKPKQECPRCLNDTDVIGRPCDECLEREKELLETYTKRYVTERYLFTVALGCACSETSEIVECIFEVGLDPVRKENRLNEHFRDWVMQQTTIGEIKKL